MRKDNSPVCVCAEDPLTCSSRSCNVILFFFGFVENVWDIRLGGEKLSFSMMRANKQKCPEIVNFQECVNTLFTDGLPLTLP